MKKLIALLLLCTSLEASEVKSRMFCNCDIDYLRLQVERFIQDKDVEEIEVDIHDAETHGIHYKSYRAIVYYKERV